MMPYKTADMVEAYQHVKERQDYLPVHGNSRFEYQYLVENYPTDVDYNFEQIRIANIDIEVGNDLQLLPGVPPLNDFHCQRMRQLLVQVLQRRFADHLGADIAFERIRNLIRRVENVALHEEAGALQRTREATLPAVSRSRQRPNTQSA